MDGQKKGIRGFFSKFWFLLWKDNSLKGWILSIIILFVFIRFVFFPLLGLVSGSSLPLAIVESCSMYHKGDIFSNFNSWWQRHDSKYQALGINESQFSGFKFDNGLDKGDVLLIVGVNPNKLKIGNIIVFNSGTGNAPVIHRIVNITIENGTRVFTTMGDNNNGFLTPNDNPGHVDERTIYPNQIIGKAEFMIAPFIGWVKLIFFDARSDNPGLCIENPLI